jgi:hypothetical protein
MSSRTTSASPYYLLRLTIKQVFSGKADISKFVNTIISFEVELAANISVRVDDPGVFTSTADSRDDKLRINQP